MRGAMGAVHHIKHLDKLEFEDRFVFWVKKAEQP
jgi:hypothetical protein